ncbi:hypothetical protein PQE66_gp177 [Bacillus phage PBC2]|uniref:Uncharacterized protein n=1 Tax=Bacillus phage PBC2 TaxID=1675029 RepID=A0A218KC74_9CAUD|nr:hypothetical protein PQE66_gp177 [Bacillus phage PBC2]AKQ08492.1 hypothetical protein PBC2_177 [Bacillus phage PBC2]
MQEEKRILGAYADGSQIKYIAKCFDLTEDGVLEVLHNFKEKSRHKKSFTDEFKAIVAQRDLKFSRRQISQELGINVATVKKACEQFGNSIKAKASSDNLYTLVEGVHDLKSCPSCKSDKVNRIESIAEGLNANTSGIYCKNCGDEHFILGEDSVYKVNFEYLEE